MPKRRLKRSKKRGMFRRMKTWKKPMSAEQKKIRKEKRQAQREATKLAQEKKISE